MSGTATADKPRAESRRTSVLTTAYVALVAALITARALISDLDFLSVGWIAVLAVVPLLPWIVPALAPLVERIAPRVQSVTLPGGIEVSLASAQREAAPAGPIEQVLTTDHLVHNVQANARPFTTTDAITLINGVREIRQSAADAVVVDLGDGTRWRLPNLYFVAWLLANDPRTRWLVFTARQGPVEGCFVGTCAASDLTNGIEGHRAGYARVRDTLEFHDPTQDSNREHLAEEFNKLRSRVVAVPAPPPVAEPPELAWVGSALMREMLGPALDRTAIPWTRELDRKGLEAVVRSSSPFVAQTTDDGRFRAIVSQREVALEFTRRMLDEG